MKIFKTLNSKRIASIIFLIFSVAAAYAFTNIHSENNNFRKLAENAVKGDAKARSILLTQANSDKATAQYFLGMTYFVEQNYSEAMTWLRKASEKKHARAEHLIGVMYQTGRGVIKDTKEAMTWFHRAADHGDPDGNYAISIRYMIGYGSPHDLAKGLEYLQKAADGGSASAQYDLGLNYQMGQNVEKNLSKAASLFRQAAELGNVEAQFALAQMYANGEGVIKNNIESYKWMAVICGMADAGGPIYNGAKHALASLAKQMTSAETDQARKEAIDLYKKIDITVDKIENAS